MLYLKKTQVLVVAMLGLIFLVGAPASDAKGCIKGAVVGAVVGHMAGHHAVLGAAAGCVIGHHIAKKKEEQRRLQQRRLHQKPRDQGTQSVMTLPGDAAQGVRAAFA